MQSLMCLVATDLRVVISRSQSAQVPKYLQALACTLLQGSRETFSSLNESLNVKCILKHYMSWGAKAHSLLRYHKSLQIM